MIIDIIILALILILAALGISQGFVVSALYFAAWIVGIISAWLFSSVFAVMLRENLDGLPELLYICLGALIAFLIPFLLLRVAAIIAKHFIKKSVALSKTDYVLGGVFGMFKGVFASLIILTFIHYLPLKGSFKQSRDDSVAYSFYTEISFAKMWSDFEVEATEIKKDAEEMQLEI